MITLMIWLYAVALGLAAVGAGLVWLDLRQERRWDAEAVAAEKREAGDFEPDTDRLDAWVRELRRDN